MHIFCEGNITQAAARNGEKTVLHYILHSPNSTPMQHERKKKKREALDQFSRRLPFWAIAVHVTSEQCPVYRVRPMRVSAERQLRGGVMLTLSPANDESYEQQHTLHLSGTEHLLLSFSSLVVLLSYSHSGEFGVGVFFF
jgi:hypothetical protein